MEITEAKIYLKESPDRKLKAYVTITFDNRFVVRDLKVIEGNKGLFVAMPSKRMKEPCPKCHYKNVVRSSYCNQCGSKLEITVYEKEDYQNEHRDIAHPITSEAREYIQKVVVEAYNTELASKGVTEDTVTEEVAATEEVVTEEAVTEEAVTEEIAPVKETIPEDIGDIGEFIDSEKEESIEEGNKE